MQTEKQWRYSVSLLCDKFARAGCSGGIVVQDTRMRGNNKGISQEKLF